MTRGREGDFFVCRHCGADVPEGASVCRECGSDDETGWSEDPEVGEAGYGEDEDFDYEEYVTRAHPEHAPASAGKTAVRIALIVLVVLLVVAMMGF